MWLADCEVAAWQLLLTIAIIDLEALATTTAVVSHCFTESWWRASILCSN
jgi:hypothetical protein